MKIYLLNPKDPLNSIEKKTFLQSSLDMIPLGLVYLGTVLKEKGHEVKILDFNIQNGGKDINYFNNIAHDQPEIIGITSSTTNYTNAKQIIKKVRKIVGSKTVIFWGGPHVTYLPEEPLELGLADFVVRGEAEYAMANVAKLMEKGERNNLNILPGISFKVNGKIHHNPPPIIRLQNLNKIPFPDRTLVEFTKYRNPATIVCSRGCSLNCQFCSSASWGNSILRSPSNVLDEIKILNKKFQFNSFSFVDNNFIYNKKNIVMLLKEIENLDSKISLSAEINISFFDEELAECFNQANLRHVQFGIESGNEEILADIGKPISLKEVQNKIEICLTHNIHVVCSFLIGHPNDTRDTVIDTLKFAVTLKKMGAQVAVSLLVPYPGSKIFKESSQLGIKIIDWNFDNWANPVNPVIETRYLSAKMLKSLYLDAVYHLNSI